MTLHIGAAGWSIPPQYKDEFPEDGSHLERYATRFACVEINSSFYRPHRPQTYARWAATVPNAFRFAVKIPKLISHNHRLQDCTDILLRFLDETAELGPKRGPLLLQLPPSFIYDPKTVNQFLQIARNHYTGPLICEPRHRSWFTPNATQCLTDHTTARVAADPAVTPEAGTPAAFPEPAYFRLHGKPELYTSSYAPTELEALSHQLAHSKAVSTWCIFDNTARGAATQNALAVKARLDQPGTPVPPVIP